MRRSRGIVLIAVLLIMLLLLVVGLGFMSSRSRLYESASHELASAQGEALAWAGLEDARAKLSKDPTFPPAGAVGQETFTYSEDMTDIDGNPVGSYTVTVDMTHQFPPYEVVTVTSVGSVGPRDDPRVRRKIVGEWDKARYDRVAGEPNLNAGAGRWLRIQDLGAR